LPGLLLPDFRRGVPQKTAREISGHKTDAVFNRYNIVSEAELQEAAKKIEAGAKAVIHSSFIDAQDCSNSEKGENARKPV
jgi:hypothetical protein